MLRDPFAPDSPPLAPSAASSPSPKRKSATLSSPHQPPSAVAPARRLRKGARYQDAYESDPFAPVQPLESFDSGFAVQEYIAALVRRDPHDTELLVTIPRREYADEDDDNEGPEGDEWGEPAVDEAVWIYEHLRRIVQDQHLWIATLMSECTASTCPEMQAGPDWFFLCAAHELSPSPPCCAIDYITHTSDGAQALLTSTRYFPSRLAVSDSSRQLLSTVARRLYRSFAHTYFHHQDLFIELESQTSLVRRFVALSRRFDNLVPEEALIIPELEDHVEGEEVCVAEDGSIRVVRSPSPDAEEDERQSVV
ncbi:hypothetical protein JCM10908_004995 [Rhodotorula pacifica]|uniref:uncharacterized protein n=1 Tax=Rhodotorula pacifica TaxID=1495444 RepID=UPI00317B1555